MKTGNEENLEWLRVPRGEAGADGNGCGNYPETIHSRG